MDMEEIRYLLGSTIFARAKAYLDRVEDLDCETSENGVRHLTADVRGGGRNRYHTQAWLRENGSFVSASCTCPYNENGEGPCCKHIGALLMLDEEGKTQPAAVEPAQKTQLNNIPGVVRGTEFAQESAARKDSYASSLEMLFGKKWRGDEPETDAAARQLLRTYQENTLAELPLPAPEEGQRREFAELEPELTLLSGEQPWLRLRISDGGRQYLVKSIPDLLNAVEQGRVVSYGKALTFLHRKEAFAPEAQQLLAVLRRQQSARESLEQNLQKLRGYATAARSPVAGGMALSGEGLDELVHLRCTPEFWNTFLVVIQLGSILAVVVLYFHQLNPFSPKKDRNQKIDTVSLWLHIIVAAIPAGVLGILFDEAVERISTAVVVALALIIYGIAFLVLEKNKCKPKVDNIDHLSYKTAFLIGVFQCLSLVPGTSRSGSTILGASILGCSRKVASEFSFFLAIPTMVGASFLKILKFVKEGVGMTGQEAAILIVGCLVAFVVSLIAIRSLMNYVKRHSFAAFGVYRIALGLVVLLYFLFARAGA